MARRRTASHAGSWYSEDKESLSLELDRWLDDVPESTTCIGLESSTGAQARLPTPGARVIIAPHAGYSYSGRAAAWAYKALDLSNVTRIFIIGPSHHHYLSRCALSQCNTYETPLGDLQLDLATIANLHKTGQFDTMSQSVDEAEHSIEMHLPYIHKVLFRTLPAPTTTTLPLIIPILVGNTSPSTERAYGHLLAPYLADPASAFIVSSDFAHWGTRFQYTYYEPSDGGAAYHLRSGDKAPSQPPIHESIGRVDMRCVAAIEGGSHEKFLEVLADTGNTVCGRHPIGIVMAAMEVLRRERGREGEVGKEERFRFVRYERSSECRSVRDSSVSYASGFAVL